MRGRELNQFIDLRVVVADLEAYRAELIKIGQATEVAMVDVKSVADRLGSILRRLYD